MMRNSTTLKRLLASRIQQLQFVTRRSYHLSGVFLADALDMTDTFARRHGKFRCCREPPMIAFCEPDVIMTQCTGAPVDSTLPRLEKKNIMVKFRIVCDDIECTGSYLTLFCSCSTLHFPPCNHYILIS
jgi:hypothetical protein